MPLPQLLIGVGDRFRLFIQTLNNAWKPFNSIFNSKWNQKYSFNEFIHSNWKKLFKMWQIYPKNAQILLIHISGLSFQVKWNILKTWEVGWWVGVKKNSVILLTFFHIQRCFFKETIAPAGGAIVQGQWQFQHGFCMYLSKCICLDCEMYSSKLWNVQMLVYW